ncbi:DEAD-domain-containing protein [Decorospora gaudefroyi]|uniref:RNA helicase n=1 Tax=Decorospora gaudefroyi TaxID=184978 RepID=A0A6A5K837_9PLEO|nr:DEAD-domain-containing protein [Decorospora gaudefroyi]
MKRPHSAPKKASQKAHKRQKIDDFPKPLPTKPRRKVGLDALGWKPVSMPDRLEDMEGFYGLEEIEDVIIVKDAASGKLSFETTKTEEEVAQDVEEAWQREEAEAQRLEQIAVGQGQAHEGDEAGEEASQEESAELEWEGFSDDEDAPVVNRDPEVHKESKVEKKKKAKEAKSKKQEKKEPKGGLPTLHGAAQGDDDTDEDREDGETFEPSAFAILANQPEDDGDEADVSAWNELNISEEILDSLAKLKFSKPTSIQASTIPEIMAGRDVIGKASTGSGKTLAFGIPIVESFLASRPAPKESEDKTPIALIIAPTRELAHQISAHLVALCAKGDFDVPYIASVTGGLAVQKQRRQLEKADIVVGTPGRLWEVISSGEGLLGRFKRIKFLVIDEADRLLSEGHYKEFGEILKVLEPDDEADENADAEQTPETQRQTLVFSATFGKDLQRKLAGKAKPGGDLMSQQQSMEYLLKKVKFREEKPMFIDANPTSQMASKLQEGLIECAGPEKDLYLYSLLMFYTKKRALVFTNSISAVRRITPFLQNLALPALPLHSNMPQKARLRSIERFKERPGSILVATDVAARGLDIPKVELVIHYHLPRAADTYVHRSGRTARADASGSSILICAPEEVAGVRRLVAKVHARAGSAPPKTKKTAYFIRTLDMDRRIVNRLKPRATLSKTLADTVIAKEKKHSEDDVMRQAAEDLGFDYDSEEFEKEAKGKRGRGTGRKKKEREASEMTKAEMQALRAQLKGLLAQKINTGVSARYLTSGGIDVDALMAGEGNMEFLGTVDGLGFDDDDDDV